MRVQELSPPGAHLQEGGSSESIRTVSSRRSLAPTNRPNYRPTYTHFRPLFPFITVRVGLAWRRQRPSLLLSPSFYDEQDDLELYPSFTLLLCRSNTLTLQPLRIPSFLFLCFLISQLYPNYTILRLIVTAQFFNCFIYSTVKQSFKNVLLS